MKEKNVELEVNMRDDIVWLTQNQISLLFDVKQSAIDEHISNLFREDKTIIDNNTLVAITILIVYSYPKEKDILVDLVMNFIGSN